ncbi:F0F1 ATP synthase subunit B family protein [Streptomyces fagopyri]|uniref:F0F1 ATP synthase subunit B family protein n=1 Tax=Streptomyces fagopyri TaxID=2662397 RepID=UPI00382CD074
MDRVPYPIGPLDPKVRDLLLALPLFALVCLLVARALSRVNGLLAARREVGDSTGERSEAVRARAERERVLTEALLAEARHDAVRIPSRAEEPAAVVTAPAREDGRRAQDTAPVGDRARIDAERAAAEIELRISVSELASNLVSRMVGEGPGAPVEQGG